MIKTSRDKTVGGLHADTDVDKTHICTAARGTAMLLLDHMTTQGLSTVSGLLYDSMQKETQSCENIITCRRIVLCV